MRGAHTVAAAQAPSEGSRFVSADGVRLELLRGFQLSCGDERVTVPLGAQRLLAFLALHNRPLLRVYVAGSLWLDATDERAYANLRSVLWRLRQLRPTLVHSTSSHVRLDEAVDVDVHRIIAAARGALGGGPAATTYRDDTAGGDLLPDWYDAWVETERERVRQLRLHALEVVAEELAADGRFGEAVEAAFAALAIDPLRESTQRVLVRVYIAEGNWNEALRLYRVYARRLRAEIGLEPSTQMRELVRHISDGTVTRE
jgi:DNA-binding SARP family transcriptional activator